MSVIKENDGVDPLTLSNMILNKDMEGYGMNWINASQQPTERRKTNPIQLTADYVPNIPKTDYTLDPSMEVMKTLKEDAVQQPVEANTKNPNVMSTNPDYNPCPAFLLGICRVDSKPCLFSALDYKTCGKYYLASTGDPEMFDVNPGREQAPEYQFGIRAQ